MPAPKASRMTSRGYGFQNATAPPGTRFPWSRVEEVLASARNYWIGTSGLDGHPHAAPVWAVWLDGLLYFSTGRESRKGRNLASNAAVAVHVEGKQGEIVIVEGTADATSDPDVLWPAWNAYNEKYNWKVETYPFYIVRPRIAYSFEENLGDTATRWIFAD